MPTAAPYADAPSDTWALPASSTRSPGLPLVGAMCFVTSAIRQHVPDVVDVDINLEWEPPWDPDMMSDAARQQLDEGER